MTPDQITDFSLQFWQGKLKPITRNEDVEKQFELYPQSRELFKNIKKINSADLDVLASNPVDYRFLVIVCSIYYARCIDTLHLLNEHHLEKGSSRPELYWIDLQHNNVHHSQVHENKVKFYDSFGVLYKEGHNIEYVRATDRTDEWSLDEKLTFLQVPVDLTFYKRLYRYVFNRSHKDIWPWVSFSW